MRDDTEAVVERLRGSRSVTWLRVIEDADLDHPAAGESAPEDVVAPYRWLIERVGDEVALTKAGYLPPSLVAEAMEVLGWSDEWPGKHNREDQTIPVLELRESAQRFGLVRKNRGRLLVTKAGLDLARDPVGLWWHLADRLPDARSTPERQAGVLYLLTVAAGRALDGALLAQGMSILGWVEGNAQVPLSESSAFIAARDTWAAFRRLGVLPERTRWDAPEPAPSQQARTLARAALIGRDAAARPHRPVTPQPLRAVAPQPARPRAEQAVQLTVTLDGVTPPIWRRLVVPASLTLLELHAVLQTAMGWEDYHLHMFEVDGVLYGDVEEMDGPLGDERTFTVGAAAAAVRDFEYSYDFGDGWTHTVHVDQLLPSVGAGTPHLTGGARACPPEDCGGAGGYEHLFEVLADPGHEDHGMLLEWVGGSFAPEAFDVAATNELLELFDRHTRQRRR